MSNCEINSSRIENLAVTAVNGLLLKNKYIAPDIKTNDRTPVLDGSIFIYSSSKQTKKHLKGQLPVQIKGRTVSDVESVAQFPIEKDLVKNFYALGGALFILVHISKKDPEKKSIFFYTFSKNHCKAFLKNFPKNQKTRKIELSPFPTDVENLHIFLERQLQSLQALAIAFDDLPKKEVADIKLNLNPKFSSLSRWDERIWGTHFSDCLVGLNSGEVYSLAVNSYKLVQETGVYEGKVKSGNTVFTNCQLVQENPEQIYLHLNTALKIIFSVKKPWPITIKFEYAGTFAELAEAIKFLNGLRQTQKIEFGKHPFKVSREHFEDSRAITDLYELVMTVEDVFREYDFPTIQMQKRYFSIDDLIAIAALKNHSFEVTDIEKKYHMRLCRLRLDSGFILLLEMHAEKDGEKKYVNIFQAVKKNLFFSQFPIGSRQPFIPITPYDLLKSSWQISQIINFPISEVAKSYESLYAKNADWSNATTTLLKLIQAADGVKTNKQPYLQSAQELSSLILEVTPGNILSELNYFQVIKRKGELTPEQEDRIRQIRELNDISEEEKPLIKLAAAILLGEKGEADYQIKQLSTEQRKQFKTWPIWNLYAHNFDKNVILRSKIKQFHHSVSLQDESF